MDQAVGRLRRFVGWLAGFEGAQADDLGIHAGGERQCGPDRRRLIFSKSQGDFVLALGFGKDPDEAARNAIASLRDGFDKAKHDYVAGWQEMDEDARIAEEERSHSGRSFPKEPRRPAHP